MWVRAFAAAAAAAFVAACSSGGDAGEMSWTISEAESIASVRGLPVRVKSCRGLGDVHGDGSPARYRRFACVAGARTPVDPVDTVAVVYELTPRAEYDGPGSNHTLEDVRFIGGPGIP